MLLWNLHWLVWSGNQPLLGNVGKASRPTSFWKGLDLPNAWNAVFQLRSNKIKIEKGSFPYIILFGPVGDVGASWHHTEKKHVPARILVYVQDTIQRKFVASNSTGSIRLCHCCKKTCQGTVGERIALFCCRGSVGGGGWDKRHHESLSWEQ